MSVRQPQTSSEHASCSACAAQQVVACDSCGVVIDLLSNSWMEMHRNGELYNGEIICWRCKEQNGKDAQHEGV